VAATIASVRQGDVKMEPGYDGVYGVVAARTVWAAPPRASYDPVYVGIGAASAHDANSDVRLLWLIEAPW